LHLPYEYVTIREEGPTMKSPLFLFLFLFLIRFAFSLFFFFFIWANGAKPKKDRHFCSRHVIVT